MKHSSTRRDLLGRAGSLLGTVSLVGEAHASSAAKLNEGDTSPAGEDYYEKLGVTKIINAAGTYTALTAAVMPPSVQAAVALAAKHPVPRWDSTW